MAAAMMKSQTLLLYGLSKAVLLESSLGVFAKNPQDDS